MADQTQKVRNRYGRISSVYDLLETPMEWSVSRWREELMENVSGRVLEVGVGTGKNLPHYPAEVEVIAVDFSLRMLRKAKKKVPDASATARLVAADAEALCFADDTFDTVLTSCVFCSVPDPVQGLREIRRVCKPGATVVMLEHVRSEKPGFGPVMDVLNPVPVHVYGANINRETVKNLRRAGFHNIDVSDLWLDIMKKIVITVDK